MGGATLGIVRVPEFEPGKFDLVPVHERCWLGAKQDPIHSNMRAIFRASYGRRRSAVDNGFHRNGRVAGDNDVRTGTGADSGGTRLERELLIVELEDGHWGAMRGQTTARATRMGLATAAPGTQ